MEGLFECLVPDEAAPAEKRGSEDTARARSDDAEGVDIGIKKDRIRCFEYDPLYGDNGIRTRDLCVANATLSQLSYVPATAVYYSAEKAETELEISDFQVPEAPEAPLEVPVTCLTKFHPSQSKDGTYLFQ